MKALYFVAVAVVVFLGIALRSVEIFNGNYVFGFDQGRDFMAAHQIVSGRKLTLIGAEAGSGFAGLPGVFHGPGYYYLLSVMLVLFRGNPYGAILLSYFMSLLNIILIFFFVSKIFNRTAGVIAAVLTSLSPPMMAQARMIWAPHLSSTFILFTLIAVFFVRKPHSGRLFLAAFLSASLYNFELPFALAASFALLLYTLIILRMRTILAIGALFTGFAAGILPMILFEARHGWPAARGVFGFLTGSQGSFTSSFGGLISSAGAFRFNLIDTFPKQALVPESLFLILFVGAVIFVLTREQNVSLKQYPSYLVLLVFAHYFLFSLSGAPVYGHYLTILPYAYILLFAYISLRLLKWYKNITIISLSVYFVALATTTLIEFPKRIIQDWRDWGGTAKIKGKIEAIDAIYRDAAGQPFGLLVFTPPVYTYPYDYLLVWYAGPKYGFIPPASKEKVFYLLIEPDPEKPWSYKGWLETVVQTGRVLENKELPSGFIIQKRLGESV